MEGKNMECDTESPSFFSVLCDLLVTNSYEQFAMECKDSYKPDWTEVGELVQEEMVCLDL